MKKQENQKHQLNRDSMPGSDLWTDGLICAFEAICGIKKTAGSKIVRVRDGVKEETDRHVSRAVQRCSMLDRKVKRNFMDYVPLRRDGENDTLDCQNYKRECHPCCINEREKHMGNCWIPVGWSRIYQLLETVHVDTNWESQPIEFTSDDDSITVADVAAPYWEQPVGPTWWCHVAAEHPSVQAWLRSSKWLHPAINIALRDESKLISERMKHLYYEVPVRVAGGLLFELLGQSAGDPYVEEDDIPVVLRSWQAQNFLVTALHVKGSSTNISVLGIAEVQELLAAGGGNVPQTIHEVIALLASRLARWDDRLFRKYIFGVADEVELKFMDRRNHEDMQLFSVILNQEIRRLSSQVIRVKWSLHAREEIIFELLQHLRSHAATQLLEGITKSTRQMIEEQEAVRDRLFTIQDVMQSTVRAWLQDRSLRVTHNLGVFGGCGLVLSIITGLFGINVDGIPGSDNSPYAFLLFSCIIFLLGVVLIVIGLIYLGLKKPVAEEEVEVRKLELQELVRMFQQEAESHAQVRKSTSHSHISEGAAALRPNGNGYILIP